MTRLNTKRKGPSTSDDVVQRLVRIETRIVKLLLHHGLDENGQQTKHGQIPVTGKCPDSEPRAHSDS